MKIRFSFVITLLFAMANTLLAQSDDQPLSDSGDATSNPLTQSESEDIPPPEPIPAPRPVPAPRASALTVRGGEVRASDFGVSYVPTDAGLQVRGVIVGSPAQAAGLKPNDTIVSVNGQPVQSDQSLVGEQVQTVGIMRAGQPRDLEVAGYDASGPMQPVNQTPAPRTTYAVPRTTYSAPQSYRYAPSYTYRSVPSYSYRSVPPYYPSYRLYSRPSVAIGIGSGGYYGRGYVYPGMRYGGYGRGPYGGYGRGYYGGRGGVGISIGGIGIRF